MAEIMYSKEHGRHQLRIESVEPIQVPGELSLSVSSRVDWGSSSVKSNVFVLLGYQDLVALHDATANALANIRSRPDFEEPKKRLTVKPKKFRLEKKG